MGHHQSRAHLALKGKKRGMTQRFDSQGNVVDCTVIEVVPNCVSQIKTKENDGYTALQIAADPIIVKNEGTLEKRVSSPLRGHFKKASIAPHRELFEVRLEDISTFAVGQALSLADMGSLSFVDVTSVSKGKGHQGVMKRYNFRGGPASHGSGFHRHGGSTGMRSTPGRTLPGQKKSGHMGSEKTTVQNLKVVSCDLEKNILIVQGSVPGPVGATVRIRSACKKVQSV